MELHKVYETIEAKTLHKTNIKGEFDLADDILRAAFIKNLQFNLTISRNKGDNLYFFLPILRGVCEDIIFINYLYTVIEESDRQNFILLYQLSDLIKSAGAQEDFFTENKNYQPILTRKMIDELISIKFDLTNINRNLKLKYNWNRKFPTVKQIAEDGNIIYIYNYLYAATSRLVHFNPQTLLQMIWGNFDIRGESKSRDLNISIEHCRKYYNQFCLFYGSELFKIFVNQFGSQLKIEIKDEIEVIKQHFKNGRWPELVTHEELNIHGDIMAQFFYEEKFGIDEEQYLKLIEKFSKEE